MIYEQRTYQVHAGKAADFLRGERSRHHYPFARLIGCWTKESGVLNSIVFLWAYDDFADRTCVYRRATHSDVGFVVTLIQTRSLRFSRTMPKA